jgi:uncharacterized protein (TIGR01244 family)
MFRRLDDSTYVAGQIGAAEVTEAARLGVTTIVNNRPDGEEPGQPTAAEIEASARAAGLDYRHLPISGGLSGEQVRALAQLLDEAEGKVLLFCRSGTRSTYLWALAEAGRGVEPDILVAQAAAAGYDLSPLLPHLRG